MRSRRWVAIADPPEVGLSDPLQTGVCFLRHPIPTTPTAFLAVGLPEGRGGGLTTFLVNHTTEAGPVSTPMVLDDDATPQSRRLTDHMMRFSSLRISIVTAFINSSVILPISVSLAPHPVRCYQNLRRTSRLRHIFSRDLFDGLRTPPLPETHAV